MGPTAPFKSVVVKEEPSWSDSAVSEADMSTNMHMEQSEHVVKEEVPAPEHVKKEASCEADPLAKLYSEDEVKEEIVLGPETVQRPKMVYTYCVPVEVDVKQDSAGAGGTVVESESETAPCGSETARDPQIKNSLTSIETVEVEPEPAEADEAAGESGSKTKGSSSKLVLKTYICDTCQKVFSDAYHLNRHSRVHTGEKPYTCTICHNKFANSRNLNHHLRIHTGERPYECMVCEKKFTNSSSLHVHERIHTGERPHSCRTCGKQFAQRSTLVLHERTHTGEKPYECKICPKSFIKLANLKLHERSHRGEKPYACKQCDKRFTQSMNLKLHERIHRQDTPETILQQQICTFSNISCDRHE
ncbi:zinc finger protein 664-like [Cydia fagiglandana]|uniref:zinc finger protein 664-like n=1 Tax=Cydia fagiglandana TaxID=1458189 RepID=UPI002FEDF5A5